MDTRLLALLVCPICKGPLQYEPAGGAQRGSGELICRADRLAYPIRDGIPLMIEDQARAYDAELEAEAASGPAVLARAIAASTNAGTSAGATNPADDASPTAP